ncbi:hypothetical protein BO71DRAFT_386584 [Aspergillus ellipticus CBS 707.79]|uniref:Tat pathway signal sequence n=1 Tax=Aspergillus ellipticus CBS 707.79 TaxID=1448320 RepID=A0A319D106_9EURO|nr:hypothetical protein BO71DRAFT_386584 [Aspergillus ellipticus CBS 707.79]
MDRNSDPEQSHKYPNSKSRGSSYPHLVIWYLLPVLILLLALNLVLAAWLYARGLNTIDKYTGPIQYLSWELDSQGIESDQNCVRRLSTYTPALEAIEYHTIEFEHSSENESTYRGPPTVEREQAWADLWRHEGVLVPKSRMPTLSKSNLSIYQEAKPEKGDGYIAWMEVHHQLECLNQVRQYTWFQSGHYPPELIPEELLKRPEKNRQYVDHCIETLRQAIMCHGDMTPMLVTKERDDLSGWRADLHTRHVCRDFSKLQDWVKTHGVEDWPEGEHHSPE